MGDERKSVRLRTAADRKKALGIYDEMRRGGRVARAMVIVETPAGHVDVLGQGLKLHECAELLVAASRGVASVAEQMNAPRREPAAQPAEHGPVVGITTPEASRGMKTDAEGMLVPPEGESIISCSLCSHPRWHATVNLADHLPQRLACAHCGNELIFHRMRHREGSA